MIRKKLFILTLLLLLPWLLFAKGYSARPKTLYQTSVMTYKQMQPTFRSPNHTAFMGSTGNDGDPGNWADPFGSGGSSNDPSDPGNWADPFGTGGQNDDPGDPGNWEDPFSHVPVGATPWVFIALLAIGYTTLTLRKKKTNE